MVIKTRPINISQPSKAKSSASGAENIFTKKKCCLPMTFERYKMNNENSTQQIKKYTFYTNSQNSNSNSKEELEILIPEKEKSAGYSLFTWRCAPLLAWFLWDRRKALPNKKILEIGCGTALPGILAAKCGAHVTLSDSCTLPKTLNNIHNSCLLNNLNPGKDIDIIGLSWGVLLNNIFTLGPIDYIIASDCFYDPSVFEDILATISFLLDRNPLAKFLFSYQVRSSDWSIEALLKKWNLVAININIDRIGRESGLDLNDLLGNHTIHLLEISKS